MTTNTATQATTSISPAKKIRIAVALLIAAVTTTAVALHYGSDADVSTEDAYVDGNIVQVTPQLGGSVIAITADNTDYVLH